MERKAVRRSYNIWQEYFWIPLDYTRRTLVVTPSRPLFLFTYDIWISGQPYAWQGVLARCYILGRTARYHLRSLAAPPWREGFSFLLGNVRGETRLQPSSPYICVSLIAALMYTLCVRARDVWMEGGRKAKAGFGLKGWGVGRGDGILGSGEPSSRTALSKLRGFCHVSVSASSLSSRPRWRGHLQDSA